MTSVAFQIGIVIEIIDDSDFSRARKTERPSCMWENNNKRNVAGIGGLLGGRALGR